MDDLTKQAYRVEKAKDPGLSLARFLAERRARFNRRQLPEGMDLHEGREGPELHWRSGPFELVGDVDGYDESPDLSYLGELSYRAKPGADEIEATNWHATLWYTPAQTIESRVKELRAMGYGKVDAQRMAREYYQQDLKRLLAYEQQQWAMVNLRVRAFFDEREMGVAYLGGVESDSTREYLQTCWLDMAESALDEARTQMRRLLEGAVRYLNMSADERDALHAKIREVFNGEEREGRT